MLLPMERVSAPKIDLGRNRAALHPPIGPNAEVEVVTQVPVSSARHHAAGADVVLAVTTRPAAGSNDDDITHLAPFPRGRV
jgi:hypothetical protein